MADNEIYFTAVEYENDKIYTLKYNKSGDLIWENIECKVGERITKLPLIEIDREKNIFIGTDVTKNITDSKIVKYDKDGELLGIEYIDINVYDSSGMDRIERMRLDHNNDLILALNSFPWNYIDNANVGSIIKYSSTSTLVREEKLVTAYNYSLSQNYPNPFNPSTKIVYSVKGEAQNVRLTVCNVLGQEIAVLVNREQNAGSYEAEFDGSGLTSGVYFYRLHASTGSATGFVESKKMILLR